MGIKLYVGAHGSRFQARVCDLTGSRCFSAAYSPPGHYSSEQAEKIECLLDSGAFTDPPAKRLSASQALERQLAWERKASKLWKTPTPWQAQAIVSYDLLIDEVWIAGNRHKRRWSVQEADMAVRETIKSAQYLASQRNRLFGRSLVLACQGVDMIQYDECVTEVLKVAREEDWVGLGGWCILGRFKSWLGTFWATLHKVLPRIAEANVKRVHIFGVLYQPALGGLLWLADEYGLSVSTDSSAPILSCVRACNKKAGVRAISGKWEDNVAWWVDSLADIRESEFYKKPSNPKLGRQLSLL